MKRLMCLLLLPAAAFAMDPGPSSSSQRDTETWLQLAPQRTVQSPTLQPASAAERDQSLQRWLNSYQHPIPEFLKQDSGSGKGGGSSR